VSVIDKRGNVLDVLMGGLEAEMTVGIHASEGATEHDGLTNAELGAIHEFGTSEIPQRSFIRVYIDEHESEIHTWLSEAADELLTGADPQQEADRIALRLESGVKERILSGISPELSEATKKRRGDSAVPLIDTSQMLGSIRGKAEIK
jgi:hypothetical protein